MSIYFDPDCNPFNTSKDPSWSYTTFHPLPEPSSGPNKAQRLVPDSSSQFVDGTPMFTRSDKEDLRPTLTGAFYVGEIGQCLYCLKVGKHNTAACSYRDHVPKNETVGPGCDLVCKNCHHFFGGDDGCRCSHSESYAVLKICGGCGRVGDHWGAECPRNNLLGNTSHSRPSKFGVLVDKLEEATSHPQVDRSECPSFSPDSPGSCISAHNQSTKTSRSISLPRSVESPSNHLLLPPTISDEGMSIYFGPDCKPFNTSKEPSWSYTTFHPLPEPSSGPNKAQRLVPDSSSQFVDGTLMFTRSGKEELRPTLTGAFYVGEIGQCLYCLKVGEHNTAACSYRDHVPKNETVGPGCDLVCKNCHHFFGGDDGCRCSHSESYAVLKICGGCGRVGDHWGAECPRNNLLGNTSHGRSSKFGVMVDKLEEATSHPQVDRSECPSFSPNSPGSC